LSDDFHTPQGPTKSVNLAFPIGSADQQTQFAFPATILKPQRSRSYQPDLKSHDNSCTDQIDRRFPLKHWSRWKGEESGRSRRSSVKASKIVRLLRYWRQSSSLPLAPQKERAPRAAASSSGRQGGIQI